MVPNNKPPDFTIITQDLTPENLLRMGWGGAEAENRYPGLLQTLADTHNRMNDMIATDMANIIAKRQRGEMDDQQYAFMLTLYPDLPAA